MGENSSSERAQASEKSRETLKYRVLLSKNLGEHI